MIAWGGAAFAQSLVRLGLVDEYRLVLQPVALGEGLPLFKGLITPLSPSTSGILSFGSRAQQIGPWIKSSLALRGRSPPLQDADAVLKLRAIHASRDWPDYWAFHEKQEARRRTLGDYIGQSPWAAPQTPIVSESLSAYSTADCSGW